MRNGLAHDVLEELAAEDPENQRTYRVKLLLEDKSHFMHHEGAPPAAKLADKPIKFNKGRIEVFRQLTQTKSESGGSCLGDLQEWDPLPAMP